MKDVSFFAQYLEKREKIRLDSVIAVDSGSRKGTGKTVFSIQLCKESCKLKNYPYSLELMIMNATEEKLIHLVKTLPMGVPIHVDEAIFLAYKRDYNEDPVKKLVKFINICRKFRKPILLNTPSFWDLDKDIRNLCDFRVTIIKRGIAIVRHKNLNPEYEDLWMRSESKDIIDKESGSDITDLNSIIRGMQKCKNYLFTIVYPDLAENEYVEYEKLSMREEGKSLVLDEKRLYPHLRMLTYLFMKEAYFKNEDGSFVKVTSGKLVNAMNRMVAASRYALQYDKYKTTRSLILSFSRDWRESIEKEGCVIPPIVNNSKITYTEEVKENASGEEAVSLPDDEGPDDLEEIA